MKKTVISCLAAASVASVIFAASDKIGIISEGILVKMLAVDDIEQITYSGEAGTEGYTHMVVDLKNSQSQSVSLDEMSGMVYQHSLGDCPVTIEVTPRYESAQLKVTSPDPDTYYRISGYPESMLEEIGADESIWAQVLMEDDIAYIYSVAEYYGKPLSEFDPDDIFSSGSQTRDWFPSVQISGNTPIALVVYSATLEGDEIVPTSDPTLIRFSTRKLEILDVPFQIDAEMTSNSITVKADAPEEFGDMPFYVTAYSKDDVEAYGLDYLVSNTQHSLENKVWNYGSSWEAETFIGHGETTLTNRLMGEEMVGVAFGIDYGIVNTVAKSRTFVIPEPEIVDDCVFTVTATQQSPSEFILDVAPSRDDTRYAALLVEKSKLSDTNTPAMAIARTIRFMNSTHTIDWNDSELIFTGTNSLSTHDDMLEGVYLNVGTDYVALIFGVDVNGRRTTEIKEVEISPQSQVVSSLSFDVAFSDFDSSSKWTHMLTATVTPSDPDAKYVFVYLPASNRAVDLTKTDEELMTGYVEAQGEWLELHTGELTKRMSFGSEYDSEAGGYVFKEFVLMIYGYDGEITSPLYAYTINSDTGEAVQVRGPKEAAPLTFDIVKDEFTATNKWAHYLKLTVTPSDPEAKYVVEYLSENNPSTDFTVDDATFIKNYVDIQGEYLTLHTGELEKTCAFGSEYDSEAGGYVFKPYILFVFGYDGEATSDLYMYRVNTDDGTMEQLRGPGME